MSDNPNNKITVAAFSGSLRKESFTTKLVKAFAANAPENVTVNIINISKLPLLNEDLEADLPHTVGDLHASIRSADAILLATPEYNRSYTPAIKNALDWGSRPAGNNEWNGKPAAVIGCTPYTMGAAGAVHHLRQVLVYLNMPVVQQPEFYLSGAGDKFNEQGELIDETTRKMIVDFWTAYVTLINRYKD